MLLKFYYKTYYSTNLPLGILRNSTNQKPKSQKKSTPKNQQKQAGFSTQKKR